MADHENTQKFDLLRVLAILDAHNDFLVMHRRPVDADEIAVGIAARLFPMPRQATAGAIGTAAFRVGGQEIGSAGCRWIRCIRLLANPCAVVAAVASCTSSGERDRT
jgi:hypothetical protein